MAFLAAILFVGLFAFSDGNIWEHISAKSTRTIDLRRIPSLNKTAETLEGNFLKRNATQAVPGIHKPPDPEADREVVILVDSSGSIAADDFRMGLRGLQDLLDRMKPQTKVAVVTFSTEAHVTFPFVSVAEAKRLVPTTRHESKKTNTLKALEEARKLFKSRAKEFPDRTRERQVFMITDGKPNAKDNTIPKLLLAAARLKLMKAEIFILLVGENVDGIRRIAGLASSADRHFYRVRSNKDFVQAVNLIQKYFQQG